MSTSISIKELKEPDPSSYQIVDIRDAVEIPTARFRERL